MHLTNPCAEPKRFSAKLNPKTRYIKRNPSAIILQRVNRTDSFDFISAIAIGVSRQQWYPYRVWCMVFFAKWPTLYEKERVGFHRKTSLISLLSLLWQCFARLNCIVCEMRFKNDVCCLKQILEVVPYLKPNQSFSLIISTIIILNLFIVTRSSCHLYVVPCCREKGTKDMSTRASYDNMQLKSGIRMKRWEKIVDNINWKENRIRKIKEKYSWKLLIMLIDKANKMRKMKDNVSEN